MSSIDILKILDLFDIKFGLLYEYIKVDNRLSDELLDMMDDYDFLRGNTINWYLLEAFFNDAGFPVPNRKELEKYYTIED
jgi:hypothetical protein